MGTRKLELKDICGYFPYGLGVRFRVNTGYNTGVLKGYNRQIYSIFCDSNSFEKLISREIEDIKPVLHPISDLYKTITHNGKEIVPIIHLLKVFTIKPYKKIELQGKNVLLWFNNGEFDDYELFGYDERKRCFFYYNTTQEIIQNQHQLFDYLHELKIDYRGLIDAGLAIDVNTLNENPYK